jgi:hypothetical protein
MARVRLPIAVLGTLVLLLAGCGASAGVTTSSVKPPIAGPATLAGSGAKTTSSTARFTITVAGVVGGANARAEENGTLSFTRRAAHIYKLVLGGGVPQEVVVDGPITYTNGNVEAAMNDSTIKPWTRLDTRRLTAKQRRTEADELTHVRAAAYLVYGVAHAQRLGTDRARQTHFRGTVDPVRLAERVPAAERAAILGALQRDYVDRPFPADFWVDAKGRVRRVHVAYRTAGGGRFTVDAAYSGFGTPVDLRVPPAREVQDITP